MGFTVDPDLVVRAQRDRSALEVLLARVWPEAYRVALGIVRDPGLAEDAAQDACADIAGALGELRATPAFYGWMYRIIVRRATAAARRWKPRAEIDSFPDSRTPANHDDRLDVLAAVAALPIAQRTAVVLRYYAGLNAAEISAALGLPAPTVRFHLMLARRTLRVALAVIDSQNPANLEACHDAP